MATDVIARLKLRAENFSREVRKTFAEVPGEAEKAGDDAGRRMGDGLGRGLKKAGIAAGVGMVVREIAQVTMRAVDFGVQLDNSARAINSSVEELQAYRDAAAQVGVASDRMNDGLQQLFQSMTQAAAGGKSQSEAFRDLGVSLTDTNGFARATTSVMGEVIDKLAAVPDPLRQARIGTELFGEKWRDMAPLLDAGSDGLQNLADHILETGDALSSKEIQELNRINTEFERMQSTLERDIARVVANNADGIIALANAIGAAGNMAAQAITPLLNFMQAAQGYRNVRQVDGLWAALTTDYEEAKRRATPTGYIAEDVTKLNGLRQQRAAIKRDGYVRAALDKEIDALSAKVARLSKTVRDNDGMFNVSPPPTSLAPVSITPPKVSGGGKSRPKGGGIDKEAREREQAAKRLAQEYARIEESLTRALTDQQQAAEVEELRADGLDRQADYQEALNRLNDKWRDIAGKTAKEVAERFNITIAAAQQLIDHLDRLRGGEVIRIDLEHGRRDMEEMRRGIDKDFEEHFEKQLGEWTGKMKVTEAEARRQLEDLSGFYFDLFNGNTRNIWENFKRMGLNALAKLAANQTMKLLSGDKSVNLGASLRELFSAQKGDLIGGMSKGALASSIAGAIGIKQSNTGAMIGSAAGSLLPLGPLGGAIGGLLGGTIGGLFKKSPRGWATIGGGDDGASVIGQGGNSGKARKAGMGAATATLDSLDRIAEALGATFQAGGTGVSIGRSGDSWHVDPTGRGRLKKKQGGIDFDDDYEAAVRYATSLMLERGVLGGISDASQRIMKNAGDDIDAALEKALMIEDLPKALRRRFDPLGAALDEVDAKFQRLADVLKEGGGSAEQIAQARQLWELERADAVREIGAASATLAEYLKTLRIGADSPLSLRTQAAEAEAAMAPYLAQIRAAEEARGRYDSLSASGASAAEMAAAKEAAAAAAATIDQQGFRDSAALFLDVARQMGGSTRAFFEEFERIQGLTNSAIALVENAVPLRGDTKDPFAELTAKSTQATANILDGHTAQLAGIAGLLQQIAAAQGGASGASSFIGADRLFVA